MHGLSDTFSKFTGSVGKGLATATLDTEFQEQRRLARNRYRMRRQGVTAGASSFARSIVSGVTGIVEQPLKRAEKDGVGGFIKGMGIGLLGAITKPAVGVFDLASHVTEGIKNSTTSDDRALDRVRIPRYIGRDRVLKPYNARDSSGAFCLRQIEDGEFAMDQYMGHTEIRKQHLLIILTQRGVIAAITPDLKLDWTVPWTDIQSMTIASDRRTVGLILVDSQVPKQRVIQCESEEQARSLFHQLTEIRQYQARRRLDHDD